MQVLNGEFEIIVVIKLAAYYRKRKVVRISAIPVYSELKVRADFCIYVDRILIQGSEEVIRENRQMLLISISFHTSVLK